MPLYEFQCKSCDIIVEVLVRSPDSAGVPDDADCPGCGSHDLDRVFSLPASPSVKSGKSLPVAASGGDCGAPRCCVGGCQM
ncbi:Zinc ribbon domain protein [Rubripirellula tenax]|uniref:Zinc ribbon domain protein n=1 Tax=Rubripirellula tenax TaxID=2528015 RepID=A0A5C6FH74_9BACT|nr:zinc ribbon domain-containing protein [Rubripirellula tenax]TWU60210.1 Zinc ribbon domain protein [Rubripirellula tenax]